MLKIGDHIGFLCAQGLCPGEGFLKKRGGDPPAAAARDRADRLHIGVVRIRTVPEGAVGHRLSGRLRGGKAQGFVEMPSDMRCAVPRAFKGLPVVPVVKALPEQPLKSLPIRGLIHFPQPQAPGKL